jgi:YidC/Oxa1 family membrane protein insertase
MMDRNTIIGLLLITAIIIGWMIFATPSEAERKRMQAQQDSIAHVQKETEAKKIAEQKKNTTTIPVAADSNGTVSDSVLAAAKKQQFGVFSKASEGKSESIVIENELMKVTLSSKGGRVSSVQLKKYFRYGTQEPVTLFNPDSSYQSLQFTAANRVVVSDSLYFTPQGQGFTVEGDAVKQVAFRLATDDPAKYIEYVYTMKGNDYMMGYSINIVGMNDVIQGNENALALHLGMSAPTHEKSIKNEREATTAYFKYTDKKVDYLPERSDERKALDEGTLKWISFKQQFFTSVYIAETNFGKPSELETKTNQGSAKYVRHFDAQLTLPYTRKANETFAMKVYYGPNHYGTLKQYDLDLERQVPLGWGIFGWVNRFLVIPVFNWLNSFNISFGVIILVLTIIIKLLLFPVAYKMYISSAKMRVLKPEIEEINKRHENGDPMKKQQEIMSLYKKAGVSPLAGCVPMLLQLPILIALVNFFPSSIEMRGESFLWAEDLSTYDSLIHLPFNMPFLGNHLSLFAILMTISTIVYTWYNSQLMGTSQQMPGMKLMMYLMPVLFLGFLNTRSAGLSYYYLLANLISIGQAIAMQRFVDQDALHRKIEENKKKPVTQSKWQQRMESMMKAQQEKQGQLKKGKK